jgi:hypothetical protein
MRKSVFTIWQPKGELQAVIDMRELRKNPFPNDKQHTMQITQIVACKLAKLANCPILKGTGAGTAFLIHDQSTIATVLHNVQTWLHWAKKLSPGLDLRSVTLPVFMTDLNGNVVFNPLAGNQKMHLIEFNPSPEIFARPYVDFKSHEERIYISASEFVELAISPALTVTPFRIGDSPTEGQRLVAVGYPMKTTVFGSGNSDGSDLYASVVFADRNVPSDWPGIEMHGAIVEGNSGSPILNSKNEVVGIAIAGACSLKNHSCKFKNGLPVMTGAALKVDLATNQKAWKQISDQPMTPPP